MQPRTPALHDAAAPAEADGHVHHAGRRSPAHRLVNTARAGLVGLANVITPPLCLSCHQPLLDHDTLCPDCWRSIDFIRQPLCDRLGIPLPYDSGTRSVSAQALAAPPIYGRARAVARYDGVMRDLIHDLKFHDRHDSRRLLGRWLAGAGGDLLAEAEVLVPIPLHRWKLLRRRFNQSAILALEVSRLSGLPTDPLALRRTRATRSQLGLSQSQRQINVNGAFSVPPRAAERIAGRRVLLVDDVITTGATISAAARALLQAGAGNVDVLALAIVTDTAGTLTA